MVITVIKPILLGQMVSLEVKAESEREWDEKLHRAMDELVHGGTGCDSYFVDKVTGKNWFVYPWNSFHMWIAMHWNIMKDWEYQRWA
ncbi:hypothetical protein BO71DRAFT_367636 [Aspergillus ellipticus CBS 707.79]|uniref:Uncharacterized protein n=1 Tax=Aspergillus ellipticus CBS 707.79 TaxID=1448320 RepID=A0A319DR22_9EURO|nr:hypothetical protein BO71DRAFT_367636 [Aspergillus ellipticus CBS 707.79]